MKIATWNINGVKARLEARSPGSRTNSPTSLCFQEIKSVDEGFPREIFEELGYNVAIHGQKGFNGVAILSKSPLEDVQRGPARRRRPTRRRAISRRWSRDPRGA